MEEQLNNLLADFVVEYHKLQNFHWYVKGKRFFVLHTKLEEFYNGINVSIDELAEVMLMLDLKPVASLKEFLANTSIKEASMDYINEVDVINEVLTDFAYLLTNIKNVKTEADKVGEFIVSALMDNYISEFSKSIWMLKQSIKD